MASQDRKTYREENSSEKEKSSIFGFFKRQRINSDEEKSSTNDVSSDVLNKLSKMDSDLSELKTGMQDITGLRHDLQKVFSCIEEVKSSLKSVDDRFDKQEKKLELMSKKMEAQSKEIENLRGSLRTTQDKVYDTEVVVQSSKDKLVEASSKIVKLDEKAIDLGARGRRNNLIFHGISESVDENCLAKVRDFIKKKCKIDNDVVLEVAHRIGGKKTNVIGTNANKPRPMIARFLNRGERDMIKRTKKDLPKEFGLTDDFPYEIRMGRRELIPLLLEAKKDHKEAYITYPCKLYIEGKLVRNIDPANYA